ncbi:MAG TPA: saccharopine dehydrogenase NADP-binding domain-containing protein [Candidatus Acidoferrales bacterium]|jgi:saccharopine dehydrogenase (NAD+, L-lysine-forming)|nr:saccharopine dehydrogenase NADP-binding domain-containing protein [Candidatus Acidoferrales bacterium]
MRIFIVGAGATGSLLAQLLERQGHDVWCGDRDPDRARRFLGKRSAIPVATVNARNLRGIVRAGRGCQLIINASASVFNEIVLRAALRLRSHYLDLSSHLARNPFQPEQFRYAKKFEAKHRVALINTGAAPGLTNLLVKRAADLLDEVGSVQIRLYESTEGDDPISQWSPEVSFDEAISNPRIYRHGKYKLARRFSELEKFRFPDPIGSANVVLAAQDEVATLPKFIPMQELDVKIGGNEFDRLRRWHKQGKLSKSRGLQRQRFPETSSPRKIAALIRRGILQNARFAASVLLRGVNHKAKDDEYLLIRSDALFPTLYQIRQQGLFTTAVAYGTAHVAAQFVKFFPRDAQGVLAPEQLPAEIRRAILSGVRNHGIKLLHKVTELKPPADEDELL